MFRIKLEKLRIYKSKYFKHHRFNFKAGVNISPDIKDSTAVLCQVLFIKHD